MKLKLPKEIRIGGHRYKIFLETEVIVDDMFRWGQADHRSLEITISKTRVDSQKREALIHELLHTIDAVYGGLEIDENTINVLAKGLNQVLDELNLEFDWSDIPNKRLK